MNSLPEILSEIGYYKNSINLSNSNFINIGFDIIKISKLQNLYDNLLYAYTLQHQLSLNDFDFNNAIPSNSYSSNQLNSNALDVASLTIKKLIDTYMLYHARPFGVNHLNRVKETNIILGNVNRDIYDIKYEEFLNVLSRIRVQLNNYFL